MEKTEVLDAKLQNLALNANKSYSKSAKFDAQIEKFKNSIDNVVQKTKFDNIIVDVQQKISSKRIEFAWKDLPKTYSIDRNKFDIEDTLISCNKEVKALDSIQDFCTTFKEISSLKNSYVSATNIKILFGNLIRKYDYLDKEQRWKVLIFLATAYYIDPTVLKSAMSQSISNFESLVKVVNDLRRITEPKYLWIFKKLAALKGGQQMIEDIKTETLNMVLQLEQLSSYQKCAVQELYIYVKGIDMVNMEVEDPSV